MTRFHCFLTSDLEASSLRSYPDGPLNFQIAVSVTHYDASV